MNTIIDLLRQQAASRPEAVALTAPHRPPLTYAALLQEVETLAGAVRGRGITQRDRVAVVLPDGPELAVTFLALAGGMSCAPLNPRYRSEELEFYLSDLRARAVITGLGAGAAAREAADELGLQVLDVAADPDRPAGTVVIKEAGATTAPAGAGWPQPEDVALLLHTSGTTSRPKLVPLSQQNLCLSAANVARSLALTPADRCLCVMPLFHIHGLVAALLASLHSGASVVCAPGFIATEFFGWVRDLQPTWYTAVPTMHQSILARAAKHPDLVAARPFRLIRSCSASLPPPLMAELEQTFHAPVVEAYGMTEAAHQISCNPLPPAQRKPGSVGREAGPDVAIMDERGQLLPPGEIGEIVIRGENVTSGYEANPAANAVAFARGWFRTGDEGYVDDEGYLFIRGRIKEIINRGGEKISPREIDEALLAQPGVAQAVTFAIPDHSLGEEIGAAVVLQEGAQVSELELRSAVAQRLADFKVPRRIVFLEEIPRGATGKLQRIGLADKLGLTLVAAPATAEAGACAPPRTSTEQTLCGIWAEVLGLERVGVNDDFLELGGDSMLALRIVARIRIAFGREVPLIEFLDRPTIAGQAQLLELEMAS